MPKAAATIIIAALSASALAQPTTPEQEWKELDRANRSFNLRNNTNTTTKEFVAKLRRCVTPERVLYTADGPKCPDGYTETPNPFKRQKLGDAPTKKY